MKINQRTNFYIDSNITPTYMSEIIWQNESSAITNCIQKLSPPTSQMFTLLLHEPISTFVVSTSP